MSAKIPNFAVVVAPLHTTQYEDAMMRLTELQDQFFEVKQMNLMLLPYVGEARTIESYPYAVYFLERTVQNAQKHEAWLKRPTATGGMVDVHEGSSSAV